MLPLSTSMTPSWGPAPPVGPECGSCLEAAFPFAGCEAMGRGTVARTLGLSRQQSWDGSVPQQWGWFPLCLAPLLLSCSGSREGGKTASRLVVWVPVHSITTLGAAPPSVCITLGFQVPEVILPRGGSWVSSLGTLPINRVLP